VNEARDSVMSSASSAVTYTSVYTDSEPGRVFWGADEELSDGGDYDLWSMRMEKYLTHTDYALWEVIMNGDAPAIALASIECPIPPKTVEQKLARKNELKAKSTLLLAIPDEHLLKFHGIKDSKTLWSGIKTYVVYISLENIALVSLTRSSSKLSENVAVVSSVILAVINEAVNDAHELFLLPIGSRRTRFAYINTMLNMRSMYGLLCWPCYMRVNEILKERTWKDNLTIQWAPKNQGNRNGDTPRRIVPVETPANALVVQDGIGGYDWSFQTEEGPTNFALMAHLSSGSSSSSSSDSERDALKKSNLEIIGCQLGLESLEARIVVHQKNEAVYKEDIAFLKYDVKDSLEQPKDVRPSAPIIEEWESDSDDDYVFRPKPDQTKPMFAKINFVKYDENVKSVNKENTHRQEECPRKSQSPMDNKRNWNGMLTQKLGNGFEFIKKACFVCESFNHLIKDCDFHDKKMIEKPVLNNKGRVTYQREVRPVWNNAQRVNHQNKMTHPHPKRNFIPTAVATKSGLVPVNTAKQSSLRAKTSISTARHGNPQYALQDKGIFNSGCSRHMTGNKSYLTDYQDIDGGFVAFAGSPKGGKITGKGGLTCLFAKATIDESNLWHRRLGHINFKTMNKLVRGNLVRGLPLKLFENDHTCVACQKGKQHKASWSRPEWLFDIDLLTNSMNYEPVTAGNQTNKNVGIKDNVDVKEGYTNTVSTAEQNFTNADDLSIDPLILDLEDIGIFSGAYDDEDVGAEADLNNLETIMNITEEHAMVSYNKRQRRTNHKDYQNCLFACFLSQIEPKKVIQALTDPSWIEAMQEELLQFKLQKVWTLVDLPKGKRAIGTKWVYRNKKDKRGILVRNKARMVAQGYTQEEGIDYDEVFASVARIEAIRLFLAYASFMGLIVYQMDVKSAFLYGTIEEELLEPGMRPCLPTYWKMDLEEMSSMVELTFFLGLQVQYKEDGIFISQDKYVADILKKFDFVTIKTTSTPMEPNKALVKDEEASNVDVHLYRSMIRSFMYLTASRPDITFAVCACARFQVTPKISHLHVVKRIFRYLKGQPKLGLWYPRDSPFNLKAFSDSDYAGASLDRKSTTRGCQFLGKRLISSQCKKQTIVANSTTEAKYVAAASCSGQDRQRSMVGFGEMRQLEFLRLILEEIGYNWYALTKNPTIYVSLIEKFWQTATVRTVDNGEQEINATVDGIEFTITEASVRRHLQLADADGISKQKLEENDAEKEELRACLDIVSGDEIAMDFESLATKYPIID
ncbi:putative ribonuclease H-like domain-containing protein, partial [Tanacetum coccineum]